MGLYPDAHIVALGWLRAVVGTTDQTLCTVLPRDPKTWTNGRAITVSGVGGSPDIYVPRRNSVISFDFWAAPVNGKIRTPWPAAAQMSENVIQAAYNLTENTVVETGTGYDRARIFSVYAVSEARRLQDEASIAHLSLDVQIHWARVVEVTA